MSLAGCKEEARFPVEVYVVYVHVMFYKQFCHSESAIPRGKEQWVLVVYVSVIEVVVIAL